MPLKKITVLTVANGYTLTYDGMMPAAGHMYFTPEQLLEGFMLHIGLEMTEQLDPVTMQDFIVAACNYKDNETCVKEIEKLKKDLNALRLRRNGLANRLISERNHLLAMVDEISKMAHKFKEIKNISASLNAIIKGYTKTKPYTLKDLGVTSDDIIDSDDDETEEDNV